MPKIDLSTYVETDANNRLAITADKIDFTNMRRDDTSLAYYDFGTGYFGTRFVSHIRIKVTSRETDAGCQVWILSNTANTAQGGSGNRLQMFVGGAGTDTLFLRQNDGGAGDTTDSWTSFTLNTDYYIKIVRDPNDGQYGSLTAFIYTDPQRQTLVKTLKIYLTNDDAYRYQYAVSSFGLTSDAPKMTGYVQTLYLYPGTMEYEEHYGAADDDAAIDAYKGQTFTVGTIGKRNPFKLSTAVIKAYRQGSPGNVTFAIRATSAGLPTGSDLDTATVDGNALTTDSGGEDVVLTFAGTLVLQPGVKYALIAKTAGSSGNRLRWLCDTSSPAYTGGSYVDSADSGSSWSANTGIDFLFMLFGNKAPKTITAQGEAALDTGNAKFGSAGMKAFLELDSYGQAFATAYYHLLTGATTRAGQIFTPSATKTLTAAFFYGGKNASPTGNAVAKIYAITGTPGTNAVPTGAALATSDNLDVTKLNGVSDELFFFTFSGANRITLNSGTYYALTIEYTGGGGSNFVAPMYDGSTLGHGGNAFYYDGSYHAESGKDLIFSIIGGDSYANTPYNDEDFQFGSRDWTIEGWFKSKVTANPGDVLDVLCLDKSSSHSAANYGIEVAITSHSDISVYVSNGTNEYVATAAVDVLDGAYHHIAILRTGNTLKIYVDGVVGGTTATISGSVNWDTAFLLEIQNRFGGTLSSMGWFDELRVSKGVARYSSNFTPSAVELSRDGYVVLLAHFNGTNGSTTFEDSAQTSNYDQAISAIVGATASAIKQANKIQSSAVKAVVTVVKQANKIQSVAVKAVATAIKQVAKPISASIEASSTVDTLRVVIQAINATITAAGIMGSRTVSKLVQPTVEAVVTIPRSITKRVSASVKAVVTATKTMSRTISVSAKAAVAITKQTNKAISTSVQAAVTLTKEVSKTVELSVASAVDVALTRVKDISITITATVTQSKLVQKNIDAIASISAKLVEMFYKTKYYFQGDDYHKKY